MSNVSQKEILTQKHVIRFFQDKLDYDYLGDWRDREASPWAC
jgi:type I restriction enzyme R subunit